MLDVSYFQLYNPNLWMYHTLFKFHVIFTIMDDFNATHIFKPIVSVSDHFFIKLKTVNLDLS